MKTIFKHKWIKIPYTILLYGFALVGFGLTAAYMAIQFKWTNEKGEVDANSRVLEVSNMQNAALRIDSSNVLFYQELIFKRLNVLRGYYPVNAQKILNSWQQGTPESEVLRMLDAVDIKLKDNQSYQQAKKNILQRKERHKNQQSAFEWMNMPEWETFKLAVAKDTQLIDSAAKMTGVESRLIVSCLVGEQIRLFNSDREAYKKWIGPLKILSVESQFSLGVTGIKDFTAARMERELKNPSSEFYLGKHYEQLLDFKTSDTTQERFNRLTSYRNHFYSYLYAAVFIKQMKAQWERAGFPIDNRPEILATLFNVGYPQSVPKKNPKVGGSSITIKGKTYTFGMIAYQFYYSGELIELFPIKKYKFWER